MKSHSYNSLQRILAFVSMILVLALVSCKDDSPPEKDTVLSQLTSGIWKIESVKVDGADKTSLFEGLTLQFSQNTYTVVNGEPVWASGTWSFIDDEGKTFLRENGINVRIVSITDDQLILGFRWEKTTIGSGRMESVRGEYTFQFKK